MPEPNATELANTAAEQMIGGYNAKMADLFVERNKYAVGSPEREAAAAAILVLWVAEG